MTTDINELLKQIDDKIKEIEEIENGCTEKKTINDIDFKIDNIEENIESIYEEYMDKLDNLVGLSDVKNEIKKLVDYLIFIRKTKDKINIGNINLNMVFRGNPGTGKTTVAKIVSEILCKLGFVKNDKILETTPRDFIAGYVGQTAIKAKKTIDKAKGGVIFIDEAYTFADSQDETGHTFVHEAITEIIKEMETLNTVFIFSGYDKKMDDFIELNPGIKSRIGYDISFKDYTRDELMQMFDNKINKSGMKLSLDARDELLKKIEANMTKKNFGNGRMIDNLFDAIIREHATKNLFETDIDKLLLITRDSIKDIYIKKEGGMSFE